MVAVTTRIDGSHTSFTVNLPTFTPAADLMLVVTFGRYIANQTGHTVEAPAGWVSLGSELNTNYGTVCHTFGILNPGAGLSGGTVSFTYGITGSRTVALAATITGVTGVASVLDTSGWSGNANEWAVSDLNVGDRTAELGQVVVTAATINSTNDGYNPVNFSDATPASDEFYDASSLIASGRNTGTMLSIREVTTGGAQPERRWPVQVGASTTVGSNYALTRAVLTVQVNPTPSGDPVVSQYVQIDARVMADATSWTAVRLSGPTVTINETTEGLFTAQHPAAWVTDLVIRVTATGPGGSVTRDITFAPPGTGDAVPVSNVLVYDGTNYG